MLKEINHDIDELMILRALQVGIVVDLSSLSVRVESIGFWGIDTPIYLFLFEFLILVMFWTLRPTWTALRSAAIVFVLIMTFYEYIWAASFILLEFNEIMIWRTFAPLLLLIVIRFLVLIKFGYTMMRIALDKDQREI